MFNTARFVGTTTVAISPPAGRWQVRVSLDVLGPYSPFNEPGMLLPSYGLVHVSGGLQLGRAHLQLGVRNALDRGYPELRGGDFVSPGQPRTGFGSVRYSF